MCVCVCVGVIFFLSKKKKKKSRKVLYLVLDAILKLHNNHARGNLYAIFVNYMRYCQRCYDRRDE